MIVVKPNLIIARNMLMTPDNSKLSGTNQYSVISVSGNLLPCGEFHSLSQQTLQAFRQDPLTVQEAKKIYDQYYKLWADFRRKFRHEVFVLIKEEGLVTVVEVDNLYLNKKSIHIGQLYWSYGASTFKLANLVDWDPVKIPPGWTLNTWEDLNKMFAPLEHDLT